MTHFLIAATLAIVPNLGTDEPPTSSDFLVDKDEDSFFVFTCGEDRTDACLVDDDGDSDFVFTCGEDRTNPCPENKVFAQMRLADLDMDDADPTVGSPCADDPDGMVCMEGF